MRDVEEIVEDIAASSVRKAPFARMRAAADWLEANDITFAMYDMANDVISFGYQNAGSSTMNQITKLMKGKRATKLYEGGNTINFSIERTATSCGFRWYVWQMKNNTTEETVTIGGDE
jgi:hypothetical protein